MIPNETPLSAASLWEDVLHPFMPVSVLAL
jgi:hypothetical protein